MDQVRTALAWIVRYHFWLLCGLVSLVGAGSWYMATNELSASFEKNSKAIEAEFSAANQIRRKPYHPNETINNEQRDQNRQLAGEVRQLWSQLHDRQRNEALKWPLQLGADFVRRVSQQSFGDPIPIPLRARYQNYIQEYYPELPKIIQAAEDRRRARGIGGGGGALGGGALDAGLGGFSGGGFGGGGFGGGGFGGGQGPAARRTDEDQEEEDFLVIWADQERIRAQLELLETPSALQMWVTQEDLWVYETLLRAIAKVNRDAGSDRYSNAAIRDIAAMEVGKLAAMNRQEGNLFRPESTGGGLGGGLGGSIDGGGLAGGVDFNSGGGSLGIGTDPDSELLGGRYIDADGKPEPVTPGSYKFGVEFKRLPVRLQVQMDQRWLPQLMTELSNAPLQVEIIRVRVNPDSGTRSGTRRRSSPVGGDPDSVQAFAREPTLGEVILQGVVYIYNPVDEEALAVDDGDAA